MCISVSVINYLVCFACMYMTDIVFIGVLLFTNCKCTIFFFVSLPVCMRSVDDDHYLFHAHGLGNGRKLPSLRARASLATKAILIPWHVIRLHSTAAHKSQS